VNHRAGTVSHISKQARYTIFQLSRRAILNSSTTSMRVNSQAKCGADARTGQRAVD
jgi:hypothetical protein